MFTFTPEQIKQFTEVYNRHMESVLDDGIDLTEVRLAILQSQFLSSIEDIINHRLETPPIDCCEEQRLRLN